MITWWTKLDPADKSTLGWIATCVILAVCVFGFINAVSKESTSLILTGTNTVKKIEMLEDALVREKRKLEQQ